MKYGGASVVVGVWLMLSFGATVQAENLTTLGGVTYTDVKITKVEPDGIRLLHSGGAARIPADQIPEHFKQQHALTNFVATLTPPKEAPQTIAALDGKVYTGATIKRIEPDRLFIIYSEGATVLDFTNLPPDIQKKYGYDPLKAQEAIQKRDADEKARVDALFQVKRRAPTTTAPSITPPPQPATASATPAPEAKPAAAPGSGGASGNSVSLVDLVQLAESIDLAREEERSRLGGTVNWRPANEYDDYWYWYWSQKRGENAVRRAKQTVANGNRSNWKEAVVEAREMLKRPFDIPPIKTWLEKFIKTSELAGSNMRDDYHRRCKELIDDLDFLVKADAKP